MLVSLSKGELPGHRLITWCTVVAFFCVNVIGYSFIYYGPWKEPVQLESQAVSSFLKSLLHFFVPDDAEAASKDTAKGTISPDQVKTAEKRVEPTKINTNQKDKKKTEKPAKITEKTLTMSAAEGGGGGGFDLGTGGSADVSAYTGAFTYSYSIKVPAGRGGMNPKLALSYASSGQNGWIGLGWNISIGSIERSIKYGRPNYDDNDIFVLHLNGASFTLVNVGGNEFRLKNEGAFLRIIKQGDSWEVTDKAGTTYYFGETDDDKVFDPGIQGNNNTFQWCLSRVVDVNGNEMTFTWFKDTANNQIYIQQIDYPADYHVVFELEDRTDAYTVYTTFFPVKTAKRLKEIKIFQGQNPVASHLFEYSYSSATGKSLLTSITQYGAEGGHLPPTTFHYRNGVSGLQDYAVWSQEGGFGGMCASWDPTPGCGPEEGMQVMVADFNGDGKADFCQHAIPDLCVFYPQECPLKLYVWLSTGTGVPVREIWATDFGSEAYWQTGIADLNGDGKADFWQHDRSDRNGSDGNLYVWLSTGEGLTEKRIWGTDFGIESDWQTGIADFNGDGKADFWQHDRNGSDGNLYVWLSTGEELTAKQIWGTGFGKESDWQTSIADFNGDGKIDLWQHCYTCSDRNMYVWLSTGTGLTEKQTWATDFEPEFRFNSLITWNGHTGVADMDGDGKADFWQHMRGTEGSACGCGSGEPGVGPPLYVWLSTGAGLKPRKTWAAHVGVERYRNPGCPGWRSGVSDLNGDGVGEFWQYIACGPGATPVPLGDWFSSKDLNVNLPNGQSPDLLIKVNSPLGATTTVEYLPSSAYDNTRLPFVFPTVSSVTTTDNMGHTAKSTYTYAGGTFDVVTREFRGFEKCLVTNTVTGVTTETHHYQDQVFQGRVLWTETRDAQGVLITGADNYWNAADYGHGRAFVYLEKSVVKRYEANGALVATITTDHTYDHYGNLLTEYKYTSDGVTRFVEATYYYDTNKWLLEKPTNTKTRQQAGLAVLREARMEYDARGRLIAKKLVHNGAAYATTYIYDAYGNVTSTTNPRGYTSTIEYDGNGMFPTKATNALGHSAYKTFDARFGVVLTETNANDQTTTYAYDEFGRQVQVIFPDGSIKEATFHIEAGNHYVMVQTQTSGQPQATIFYDNLGREIESQIQASDGTIIATATHYDNAGRVFAKSVPFFPGGTVDWQTYDYDHRNRLIRQTNPDGTYQEFQCNGLIETIIDANGNRKTITKDVLGRLKRVEQAMGDSAEYRSDIFDNLTWVKDPIGNITTITYDDLGRKIAMDDPYTGHWEYNYDAVDNLVWQKDDKNQEVVLQYDPLNRPIQKDYLATKKQVLYKYDEPLDTYYNKGSLTTVAVTTDSPQVITQYNYDKMGRQTLEKRFIENVEYAISRHYDLAGRLDYIIYPDGNRFDYSYYPMGHLKAVKAHSGYQYAFYDGHNALGQVRWVTYGNGVKTTYDYYEKNYRLRHLSTKDVANATIQDLSYAFDNVGNIMGITDSHNSVNHTFTYDTIYRLTQATATPSDSPRAYNQTFAYDLAGNMRQKTGNNAFQVLEWDSVGRPTRIDYSPDIADLGDRAITYDQDNKPIRIEYKGQTTNLFYDGEGNRVKKVSGDKSVIYAGGLYEKRDGVPTLHIFANGKRIATITTSNTYFYHGDHLGSTSIVTDLSGHEVEEMGYLPFGELLYHNVLQGGQWTSAFRFTGQEYDVEYALYNYSARLYDPLLGRFITADTVVPDYTNPQSLNRYSYCLNNPLIYTDPSGHGFWLIFFAVLGYALAYGCIGAELGAIIAAIAGGDPLMGMLCGFISGAIFGAVGFAAVALSAAAEAGTIGGTTAAVGTIGLHIAAGALSGVINSAITGGDILQGMLIGGITAGISAGIGVYLRGAGWYGSLGGSSKTGQFIAQNTVMFGVRVAAGAVTGGIVSEISGGDFGKGAAQGAWTTAFAYLFNTLGSILREFSDYLQRLEFDGVWVYRIGYEDKILAKYYASSGTSWSGITALDEGPYRGTNLQIRTDKPPMICPDGTGWSLDLKPMFDNCSKTALGVHPDGNYLTSPGTAGCIGIYCVDAARLYNDLNAYWKEGHNYIDVRVKY